jgi:hypothetical protein
MGVVTESFAVFQDGTVEFAETPQVSYILGLDLGQAIDYTALSVLKMIGANSETNIYHAQYVQRFKLKTSYPSIVSEVRQLCRREPLLSNRPSLCVDQTGVGRPVVELFRDAELNADIKPIMIHGGNDAIFEAGSWRVPKRHLVSTTQVLIQTGRLKFAEALPERDLIIKELQAFQVRVKEDTGFESYEARSGAHDDIVLSLAMACWYGQRARTWKIY